MLITIDNLDGHGPLDYSGAVTAEGPITVQRALNKPSRCTVEIAIGVRELGMPVRRARVAVTNDGGSPVFTGYLATEPVRVYAGDGSDGPHYRARLTAVSDEWVLDKQGSGGNAYSSASLGLSGVALVERLAARALPAGGTAVIAGAGTVQQTGYFVPSDQEPWSVNAGQAASASYAAYRALGGSVTVQPAGVVTHAFSDANGTLTIDELQLSSARELANDVTLSGALEPAAYVQENFIGDGTTTVFQLSRAMFRGAHRTLVHDNFNDGAFDVSQWAVTDPGSKLTLTAAGLTLSGGNGVDGATTLTALDPVEMGGSIVAQLAGVVFGNASDGTLCGMYAGTTVLANCFAGFRVRQDSGVTVLVPVVNGAETGTVFTPVAGHTYTLRLRLHCVEMQRVMQLYYCMVDGVLQTFGPAGGVAAPMDMVFELVDEGAASNTPATVLYDSRAAGATLASTPAVCTFAAVNATQLYGSVGSVRLSRPGSAWVVSTLPSGVLQTRLSGAAGEGADCRINYGTETGAAGSVTFFAGRVPVAGERVTVSYRSERRSVARIASAASVASEGSIARWFGKVLDPQARSSADVENAALAVLAMATSRTAAVRGRYSAVNPPQDIWPGDVLSVSSGGVTSSLLVRSVEVIDRAAQPELLQYEIAFANDWGTEWAAGIGLRLSESIAADTFLPAKAQSGAAQVLPSLQQLSITGLSATTITLDMGAAPPAGGGFEVRRSDNEFGAGVDAADLVLRSPVRAFSIPRAAQVEEFYVRAYDGSTPPLYSRFSAAVLLDAPVGG